MSLFFGLFQLSSIIGNVIAGALIDKVAKTTFYLIMGIIGLTGSLIFLLLKDPVIIQEKEESIEVNVAPSIEMELKSISIDD